MKWSRYNLFFESKNNGWLLFNSLTRSFLSVDERKAAIIREISKGVDNFKFSSCPALYLQLRSMGFIVEDDADDRAFYIGKMNSLSALYDNSSINLTIAVTKACNFDCSYCFEHNRNGSPMDQKTEDQLIRFIKSHKTKKLSLVWYGGEPLLAFDRICSINRRLIDMDMNYSAMLVTNGYLLDDDKIAMLKWLRVNTIQITLDGSEATHNSRRCLWNGGKTYNTILQNVAKILASDYKGKIHIRVNVDQRNEDEYIDVYNYFAENHKNDLNKRIHIYPGFVKGDEHPDRGCFFDKERQGAFCADMFKKHGVVTLPLFPQKKGIGCVYIRKNAYVIGPDGEVYKCWDDVGVKEKEIGTIFNLKKWNLGLMSEGMVSSLYFDDPDCRECFYFPICDGGCHRTRVDNLKRNEKQSSCVYFKGNIEELLELHYEYRKQHACNTQETKDGDC